MCAREARREWGYIDRDECSASRLDCSIPRGNSSYTLGRRIAGHTVGKDAAEEKDLHSGIRATYDSWIIEAVSRLHTGRKLVYVQTFFASALNVRTVCLRMSPC